MEASATSHAHSFGCSLALRHTHVQHGVARSLALPRRAAAQGQGRRGRGRRRRSRRTFDARQQRHRQPALGRRRCCTSRSSSLSRMSVAAAHICLLPVSLAPPHTTQSAREWLESVGHQLGPRWSAVAVLLSSLSALWLVSVPLRNASIVDSFWSIGTRAASLARALRPHEAMLICMNERTNECGIEQASCWWRWCTSTTGSRRTAHTRCARTSCSCARRCGPFDSRATSRGATGASAKVPSIHSLVRSFECIVACH